MFARGILRFRKVNYKLLQQRNNYIVLLPEIPTDTAETNPLLRADELPPFSQLTVDKCVNAVGKLVIEYESSIHDLDQRLYKKSLSDQQKYLLKFESMTNGTSPCFHKYSSSSKVLRICSKENILNDGFQRNVQNIILPLDKLSGQLDFAWGAFKILYTVRRNEDLARSYIKLHSRIIRAKREKYFSPSLYEAFRELKDKEDQLTESVRRIVDKHLLESHFSGIHLPDGPYNHFQSAMKKLDEHRIIYRKKLFETTSKFSHDLQFNDVANFPPKILHVFSADKTNPSKGPWTVTLDPNVYRTFLEYCENSTLRWNAWNAYNTRATSISGMDNNNSINVEEIRYQRKELATILGFKSYVEFSMQTKMAGSIENVMEMITTLHVKSEPKILQEIDELQTFANKNGFPDKLELWDIPYFQRLQREELFNVDDDVVRQFFPFPVALKGLFHLCRLLFNVTIQEVKSGVDVWHEDASFYQVLDEEGKELASFYIDPYFRGSEKIQGSLIEIGRCRSDVIGSKPLSYLIFNFPPPAFGKPSLLSFEDLKNLFQKFGHLLQHSLTTIPYAEVAGLTNLEWDVVHVCPLVMNSFLKHYSIVSTISGHVDTGKPLPLALHQELLKRDNYMSGLQLTEELFLSALDLELYSRQDFWLEITKEVWKKYMPFDYPKGIKPAKPCSFPEIFSEQYPAAYFSNLWAKMIAADLFNAFEEAGLENPENLEKIGKRFRDTYLSLGGACHPGEVFRKFRGRDPSIDALLDDLDITNYKMNK